MTTEPERKPANTIVTDTIRRLNPKQVTIVVRHFRCFEPNITINLSIEPQVYKSLLKATTKSCYHDWLPLIFLVNEKGVAYDVMPFDDYKKQQEAKTTDDHRKTDDHNP